jgi:hypothetical protein
MMLALVLSRAFVARFNGPVRLTPRQELQLFETAGRPTVPPPDA